MSAKSHKTTSATRWLASRDIPFAEHRYPYIQGSGAQGAAQALGVPLGAVIKTLLMGDAEGQPLLILMHGDREVSTKALARAIQTKSVAPQSPRDVERITGYQVGGTSPFGTRTPLPVYVQKSILELPKIHINGGARGLLVELEAGALLDGLMKGLGAQPVDCAGS